MVIDVGDAYDLALKELMADFDDPGTDRIRLTERDLLIQVRESLRYIKAELASHQRELNTRAATTVVQDHENRLRVLENFRWWILGAIAVAGFVGGTVAKHLPW